MNMNEAGAAQFPTIHDIVEAARQNLPQELWDYACGGAESETTLRRNRAAFDRLAFRPRLLRDVSARDTSCTVLGRQLGLPVMLAPVGTIAQYHSEGALACARAAQRFGTATFVSTMASPSIEAIRAEIRTPLVFQLYVRGDREWITSLVRRAEALDFAAICLTADSAAYGRRERNLRHRFVLVGGDPDNGEPQAPVDPNSRERYQASFSWDDFDWLRSITRLPLIIKGIMCAEDARLAVDHGANVVHVSNHGGRQLDHLPASMDVLPEVVEAVAGRAEVIVDSGFMRGTDVIKAMALGAKAVLIGKLMVLGLGAAGVAGVERVLALLREELLAAMGNIGLRSLEELTPDYVRPTLPAPDSIWPANQEWAANRRS